MKYEIQNTNL